jgi:hypothetical protein
MGVEQGRWGAENGRQKVRVEGQRGVRRTEDGSPVQKVENSPGTVRKDCFCQKRQNDPYLYVLSSSECMVN